MADLRPRRRPHAGAVYVAVLGVAMIITLIALASIHLARVETNVLSGAEHSASAELLAQSAAEWAITQLNATPTWRSVFVSGADNPSSGWMDLGPGKVMYAVVDADGNLGNGVNNVDAADMVTIRGIANYGKATQVVSVDALPTADSLNCLDVVLHSGGNLVNSSTISGGHVVSSNGNITVGLQIDGDAWATGTISGTAITGVKNANMSPARQMPDATAVWAYYLANGTRITAAEIPDEVSGNPPNDIYEKVISPGSNPFGGGELNSQGIYIIDCQGQGLRISNSRINATLVIINPGSTVEIDGKINWNPPSASFPALMVQGNLNMMWDGGSDLVERVPLLSVLGIPIGWTPITNYNPPGSPYEVATNYDNDMEDAYPGVINGLVYASGNLTISSACVVDGVIVAGGTATITAAANLTYDQTPAVAPPPGFATGSTLRAIPRTWRRSTRF